MTDNLSVHSVSVTPLSEHESASAVCQPVLVTSDASQSLPTVAFTLLFCFKTICELDTSCIRPSPILGKVTPLLV